MNAVPGFAFPTPCSCDGCAHAIASAHPMLVACRLGHPDPSACGLFRKTDRQRHLDLEHYPGCALCEATGTFADASPCPACGGTGYALPRAPEGDA